MTRFASEASATTGRTAARFARVALLVVTFAFAAAVAVVPGRAVAADGHPVASVAAVVDCHVYAYYPNVLISSARNMTCRAARRVMRSHRGPISARFSMSGFMCARVSGGELGGQWRCASGSRAFRFEFGD